MDVWSAVSDRRSKLAAWARVAKRLGERPVGELADRLERAAGGRFHILGTPAIVALGEVLVHGADMMRALGAGGESGDGVDPSLVLPVLPVYRRAGRIAFHASGRAKLPGMVQELSDPRRVDPPFVADERTMLESWLEFHRITLLLKCEGLDDAGRKARPVTTSALSLHGLVRHMAEVERNWFQRVLLEQPDTPQIWSVPEVDDSELVPLDDADWEADLAQWQAECEQARRHAARFSLDGTGLRRGQRCSLRWIYVHMIEEYARHNGHADLIREMVDGSVGD